MEPSDTVLSASAVLGMDSPISVRGDGFESAGDKLLRNFWDSGGACEFDDCG